MADYNRKNGTRFAAAYDGVYDTTKLKAIRDKMIQAEKSGAAVDGMEFTQWQDFYNNYLKNFGDEVQNRALLSDRSYAALSTGDQADLSGVRSAALEFRTALGDNLGAGVIAAANNDAVAAGGQVINASNLGSADLIVNNDSAINKLGDRIKITRADVTRKRQEIRKKEETASGGGGGKK
jgi:hypothetical protein